MFLRNWWYAAGWTHQIQPGEIVARTMLGEPIIVYRTGTGSVAALEDRCCHRFAPLSRGRLEGDDVRCMYHGMKFAASGQCIEIPAQDSIPAGVRIRAYPVVEKDQWVWVWMGDTSRADVSLIPTAIGHEGSEYKIAIGELRYAANYQLIHDNLLDLTHLSYVHQNTLGRNSPTWGQARPIVIPLERGVRVQRWLRNHPVAPYIPVMEGVRFDHWASYDFLVPGVFLLKTSLFPVGTSERFPMGPLDLEADYVSVTSQVVTPITEKETIYYYSGGQPRGQAEDALVQRQVEGFGVAFLEDKGMIEAQQKVLEATTGRSMMTLTFDRSVAIFRRLMAGLIEAETAPRDDRVSLSENADVASA